MAFSFGGFEENEQCNEPPWVLSFLSRTEMLHCAGPFRTDASTSYVRPTGPARLVCDFGDSMTSGSKTDEEAELEQQDEFADEPCEPCVANKAPRPPSHCDESTDTPADIDLGAHSTTHSTSCSDTLASDDLRAPQVPWPQKLLFAKSTSDTSGPAETAESMTGMTKWRFPDAKATKVSTEKVLQHRSASQPCRGRPEARRPQGRPEPKKAAPAKPAAKPAAKLKAARPAQPKPAELRSSKAKVLQDAATQTATKPTKRDAASQRPGKASAKPTRKCGSASTGGGTVPPKTARPKTPRSRGVAGVGVRSTSAKPSAKPSANAKPSTKPTRCTRPWKMNRSFSAPTISATQKSKAPRRSRSAGPQPLHRRCDRCVACLMAELRSVWPMGPRSNSSGGCWCCARAKSPKSKPRQTRPPSRSCSRSRRHSEWREQKEAEEEEAQEKVEDKAEMEEEQSLEHRESSEPSSSQEAVAQLKQGQAACLDGAVQTDSCRTVCPWRHAEQRHAENSEFAGFLVQQIPEVEGLSMSGDMDRSLPCIPPSWMCVQEIVEIVGIRQFAFGGILPEKQSLTQAESTNSHRLVAALTQARAGHSMS